MFTNNFVPSDYCFRFDDNQSRFPVVPEYRKPSKDNSIDCFEFWFSGGSFIDIQLLTETISAIKICLV